MYRQESDIVVADAPEKSAEGADCKKKGETGNVQAS